MINGIAKLALAAGSLFAALGVMAGAFGAHALKEKLAEDMMKVYQTGVLYHLIHALGLFGIGLLALHLVNSTPLKWATILMIVGVVLFSGSLYALSLSGIRVLGAITPLGGLAFIAGWICALVAVLKG